MSIKLDTFIEKFRLNYFNILYFLIIPSLIVGQFLFKLIFVLIVISGIIKYKKKLFLIKKNLINNLFIFMMLFFCFNVLFVSTHYYSINFRFIFFIIIILFFFGYRLSIEKSNNRFKKSFYF